MSVGLSAIEREIEPLRGAQGQADEADRSAALPERLGGARAGFFATLGRRVAELSALATQLEAEPSSERLRDELRRRLLALAASSKLLRFASVAAELSRCEAMLAQVGAEGRRAASADLGTIRAMLDRVTSIAWGEAAIGEMTPSPGRVAPPSSTRSRASAPLDPVRVPEPEAPAQPAPTGPLTALVIGPSQLAEALESAGDANAAGGFEVERVGDDDSARDLARVLAPDVIILDAERVDAREIVEGLTSDPLTEGVPIVVIGRFNKPSEAAPFVALGAARALPRPVSPNVLRRIAAEVAASHVRRDIVRAPFGAISVDDLGARLAEELRRGLCDAALAGRGERVDLGEGNEVLAALWGAVARIRDVVTIQSKGHVRFSPSGPEGALPLASWSSDAAIAASERRAGRGEARGAKAPSIERRTIVIADDDPAVTWFLAGVLRAAGAIVHEAHDGARALDLAFRFAPDLVISDVLMPRLDGFGLCRALRRDLALRDVPVLLLSWKEDLLQRVRELGADADGYLRKEASASAITARVREALAGRARVAERIAAGPAEGAEVRGRLDGLTTRTLLGFAAALRPTSVLSVRDAVFLYEIELRNGRPVRASRTSLDGAFERGAPVLAALLGVGSGRFAIGPAPGREGAAELEGSLEEQLVLPIATARAAQRLLSGTSLVSVERVEIAAERMGAYAAAMPESARSLLGTLSAGASPRALITSGQAAARLIEDVLCDAAAHGAIALVIGSDGEELLGPAIERELDVLRCVRSLRPPMVTPVLDLGPVMYTSTPAPVEIAEQVAHLTAIDDDDDDDEGSVLAEAGSPGPMVPAVAIIDVEAAPETSVSARVEPAPAPVSARAEAAPASERAERAPASASANVPANVRAESAPAAEPLAEEPRAVTPGKPLVTLGSLTPPPVMPTPVKSPIPATPPTPKITTSDETPSRLVRKPSSFLRSSSAEVEAPQARKETVKDSRSMWLLFALAGIVFAVGARLSRERQLVAAPPPALAAAAAPAPIETAAPAPSVEPASVAVSAAEPPAEGASKDNPILPTETALRPEDKVPAGQGMLEVVAGTSDSIYIDNILVGNGPIVKRALAPKKEPYEVRVKLRGEERVRFVLVKDGRLSRIKIAPPWSR